MSEPDDLALRRVVAALAGADHPDRVDHGDARAAIETERRRADVAVLALLEEVHLAAGRQLDLVVELVLVRDIVDQPGAHGVLGQERPVVDQRAHFGFALVPAVGEPAHQLLVEIGVERLGHLAMGRRVGVLGEGVRRGLVVADVQRVGIRADLVERAAQEQLVARHAGQIERRRRHEEDLVAGGREVELLLAAVFHDTR